MCWTLERKDGTIDTIDRPIFQGGTQSSQRIGDSNSDASQGQRSLSLVLRDAAGGLPTASTVVFFVWEKSSWFRRGAPSCRHVFPVE